MKQFAILIFLTLPGFFSKAQKSEYSADSLSILLDNYLLSAKDKVTIEELLTHSSGINNYTDAAGEENSSVINHPSPK
jgi:hypothetical protein